jgi:hypothetical protein
MAWDVRKKLLLKVEEEGHQPRNAGSLYELEGARK